MLVDPELYHAEILDAIRTWMTLDSDPADHQRLKDHLEGWSLFSVGDYLFVVRLVSAGVYDRRAAYFAHGRAWNVKGLPPGCDPGLNLGRSEAFDPPWRDDTPATTVREPTPSLVRPDQLSAEPVTAALFLGHLLQAIAEDTSVIIAAPIADFTGGSSLQALISFARAALPADLRRKCRIRVYSRFPDLFLRHLRTHLVVIPEDAASAALTAQPSATLLDRQGRRVAGKELSQAARDYADAVVERAIAIPEGLPYFVERFRRQPSAEDAPAIQITYNLAFAMAGTPDRRADFLRKYLPRAADKLGEGLNWESLIGEDEWSKFPREALVDQLLTDSRDLSNGRRAFLLAVENGAARLEPKLELDERLAEWWNADDSGKLQRLAELLAHQHSLVSPRVAARLTTGIPVSRLHATDHLDRVLAAEAESGLLGKRAHESADLGRFASDPKIFDILKEAVSKGGLEPDWARVFLRSASDDNVTTAAELWLTNRDFFGANWGNVPERLLDRLRELGSPPATLGNPLKELARRIKPQDRIELYVRLADLQTRIGRDEGGALSRLWNALDELSRSQKQYLEDIVFTKGWRCFDIEHLDVKALLELAECFEKQESYERVYRELDSLMAHEPVPATDELIRRGWWYFWRDRSTLSSSKLADSAFAWLSSKAWAERKENDVTLEAWNRVVSDLPKVLTGTQLAGLRNAAGVHLWPWIPPFEEQQIDDLIQRAEDLGALAELADSVRVEEWPRPAKPIHEYVLSNSLIESGLPLAAFLWLLEATAGRPIEVLSLEQSAILCRDVRHRHDRALKARIESVAACLERDPREALRSAGHPDLWSEGWFLFKVADWMNRRGSLQAIGLANAKWIDEHVNGEPTQFLESPSTELIRELAVNGCQKAAHLLHPQLSSQIQQEQLADEAIAALLKKRVNDSCWQRLATEVRSAENLRAERRHPLMVLAERIRALSREERKVLMQTGWKTFRAAAEENAALMTQILTPPLEKTTLLPLLSVVTTMLGPGTLGIAAVRLASEVADASSRENMWLWYSLRRGIRDFKRYGQVSSADDRQETAVQLIESTLDGEAEEGAYERARRFEREPEREAERESRAA